MFNFEGETGLAGMLAGQNGEMMGSLASLLLLVLMFVIFYFIMIRPQRKKDKELKEQMDKLQVGDRVVTIGGLVGFVANIKDDQITISTSAANTSLHSQRQLSSLLLSVKTSILTALSRRLKSLRRQVRRIRKRRRLRTRSDSFISADYPGPAFQPGLLIKFRGLYGINT